MAQASYRVSLKYGNVQVRQEARLTADRVCGLCAKKKKSDRVVSRECQNYDARPTTHQIYIITHLQLLYNINECGKTNVMIEFDIQGTVQRDIVL